jgi:hypothetical protein
MTKTPQDLAAYLRKANAWRRSDTDEPMPDPTELGKAIDQVIAILEKQAQTQSIALSDCCDAPAIVVNKARPTQWHGCPQCCQPCDVFYQDINTTHNEQRSSLERAILPSRCREYQKCQRAKKMAGLNRREHTQ